MRGPGEAPARTPARGSRHGPALLASGEHAHPAVEETGEPERVGDLVHRRFQGAAAQTVQAAEQAQGPPGREGRVQSEVLGRQAQEVAGGPGRLPAELPEAMRVVDALYAALLDAGVPDARVAALERMISTFVLGFAVSEVNGRFGEGNLGTRGRRELADPALVPAHHRLGEVLDRPVDWDAEFEEGLLRLLEMVEGAARAGEEPSAPGRP